MEYKSTHLKKRPSVAKWEVFAEGELAYVRQLCPQLKAILDAELDAGNLIFEASRGWPQKESIFVGLAEPFKKQHAVSKGVSFENTNDPHYWKAAYIFDDPRHILVCPFK